MPPLQDLDFSFNDLKRLPDSLAGLCNLLRFRLCSNQITLLPHSIGALSSLQALDLQDNVRQRVRACVFALVGLLRPLCPDPQAIRELPSTVGTLVDLQVCCLRHNQLESLPMEIAACRSLRDLDVCVPSQSEWVGGGLLFQSERCRTVPCRSENGMVASPIPPTVGLMQALEVLNASKNKSVHSPPP